MESGVSVMTNNALIGAALGWGAQIHDTYLGPESFYNCYHQWIADTPHLYWETIIESTHQNFSEVTSFEGRLNIIDEFCQQLAHKIVEVMRKGDRPIVIGGDHATAIGTFSGATHAIDATQQFGLMWFDAHLDSHTPDTTPSSAIHGMPLATLLGHGANELIHCYESGPKIHPKHVVLIGIRSYEPEELALLNKLGAKIYFMDDVKERGLTSVISESVHYLEENTQAYGLTIDLDALDPTDAPGVGSPEKSGIKLTELLENLPLLNRPSLKAIEIAEYNPKLDIENKTGHIIQQIIKSLID